MNVRISGGGERVEVRGEMNSKYRTTKLKLIKKIF
jgi:hypothetical protein